MEAAQCYFNSSPFLNLTHGSWRTAIRDPRVILQVPPQSQVRPSATLPRVIPPNRNIRYYASDRLPFCRGIY